MTWNCDASLGWKRKKKDFFSQSCYEVKCFFFSLLSKRFSPESWVSFCRKRGNRCLHQTWCLLPDHLRAALLTVAVGSSSCCCGCCCCLFVCCCLLLTFDQWLPLLPLCFDAGRPPSPQPFPVLFSSTFPCAESTVLTVVSCFRLGNRFCFTLQTTRNVCTNSWQYRLQRRTRVASDKRKSE